MALPEETPRRNADLMSVERPTWEILSSPTPQEVVGVGVHEGDIAR